MSASAKHLMLEVRLLLECKHSEESRTPIINPNGSNIHQIGKSVKTASIAENENSSEKWQSYAMGIDNNQQHFNC